jgi:para-nitrobenzyl esterase
MINKNPGNAMMKKLLALIALLIAVILLWPEPAREIPSPEPDSARLTTEGTVIGFRDESETLAWLGIPYATPPLDRLRWMAPLPPASREGDLLALDYSPPCVQLWGPLAGVPGDSGDVVGSEDCLYLNIWAPADQSTEENGNLPVMFWIHGGGNTIGSANTYPAGRLAGGERVVVVTINYRLGLLGWLSHPALRTPGRNAMDASGNYGNLDMIAALQWVQRNISQFGGDADNVTIFGESAGGRNTYALMASPLASGLFHRAIVQSGSVSTTPTWRAQNFVDDDPPGMTLSSREWLANQLLYAGRAEDRKAAKAAQLLMSDEETLAFMQSRSPQQILQGLSGGAGMYRAPQGFRDGIVLPQEPLLQVFRDPERYNSVPLLTGTNRDELKLFLAQDPQLVERRFGFLPRIRDVDSYNRLAAYLSDTWKATAVDAAATVIASNAENPVFAYRWDWDEGAKTWLVDYAELLGAGHGLEVSYIFNSFDHGIVVPRLYNEANTPGRDELGRQMRSYWSRFAREGDPGTGREGDLPQWQTWTSEGLNLMVLDTAAGGGPRMSREPMTVAMVKERLAQDDSFPDLKSRCALHARLFLEFNSGDDTWDEAEYTALGCGDFDPWALIQ